MTSLDAVTYAQAVGDFYFRGCHWDQMLFVRGFVALVSWCFEGRDIELERVEALQCMGS